MAGVNKVIIVGNLGQDPEIKTLGSGQSVANLSVATSESWTGKDGNKQERTEWHRVIVWGKQAENAAKYLGKGSKVYVEGKLQTRSWDDKTDGKKRYATEIQAHTIQYLSAGKQSNNAVTSSDAQGGFDDFGPPPAFSQDGEEIPF